MHCPFTSELPSAHCAQASVPPEEPDVQEQTTHVPALKPLPMALYDKISEYVEVMKDEENHQDAFAQIAIVPDEIAVYPSPILGRWIVA